MSAASDYIAKLNGEKQADEARKFELDPGPLGGFISSAASSIPELFGFDASSAAEEFRAKYPIAGIVSEVVPTIIPYAGWAKATQIPKLAAGLESVVAKTGLKALDSPIAYGAVKEIARYAPLELTRLGVGFAAAPQENWDNLFADVGLSIALAGAGGSLLGFLKAGGKAVAEESRIAGADIGFKPFANLRMALDPEAAVIGGQPLDDVAQRYLREALADKPTKSGSYVAPLEGADPKTDATLNALFRAQASNKTGAEFDRRTLELQLGPDDARRITPEKRQEILAATNFKSIEDLASTLERPRLITIGSERAAGAMAGILDGNAAFNAVGEGVLMGREAGSGLWVVAKRIKAGGAALADDGAETAAKTYGSNKIAAGDEWIIGKTDKPQRFAPENHKLAEQTVAEWTKYADAYRPRQKADIFNTDADAFLKAANAGDPRDARALGAKGFIAKKSEELMARLGQIAGVTDSATAKAMAEAIYDVIRPTAFKESASPLYARFFGLLKNNVRVADVEVNKMLPEIAELYRSLSPEELNLVARAAVTQTPAEDLAKLSVDGLISKKAADAVTRLQEINKSFLERVVVPGLENSGTVGSFNFLDGYILPRLFKGTWQVEIKNEKGVTQWLSVGKNPGAAKAEATAVVKEAEARGMKWTQGDAADFTGEFNSDDIGKISKMVTDRMASNAEAQDVVVAAMQKIAAAQSARSSPLPVKRALAAFKPREGIAGSPDIAEYTIQDLMKATESHYRTLGRFVGYHTWRERWLGEAMNLQKMDPTLYKDLLRKGNQFMGVPGELTKAQDQALRPFLGGVAGARPATKIAQDLNAVMYNWNIGIANPTFALANLLQPLATVAPWVSYITSVAPEYAAKTMQFIPKYGPDGLPRGHVGFFHPMKVLREATRMLRDDSPEIKALYEQAKLDGTLAAQLHDDWIGGYSKNALGLKETLKQEGGWEFIKKAGTMMATKSEEYSRMISFNAGYIVGRDHFGLEGDQLYRFARRATEQTMYNYSVVDRPRMFTGPIGSMFGLFKNWQMNYIGTMAEYAGVGMRDGIWGPMLWQSGAALALGGLGGAGLLKVMADGLASFGEGSPSSYLWLKENWGDQADHIYFGLPSYLGVSLQASTSIPGTDVRNEVGNLMNIAVWERAKAIGTAVGGAWEYGSNTDQNALRDPNVRDKLAGALLPRAFFKAFAATEENYIRSLNTGYPSATNISPSGRLLTGLGLNAIEVEQQGRIANELYKDQQLTRSQVASLGAAYAQADLAQDWQEQERIIQQTIMRGLDLSSVMSSAASRVNREQGSALDRFDKQKVQRYRSAFGLE